MWEKDDFTQLNLTASSASMPLQGGRISFISLLTRKESPRPHVVCGTVKAPDHTLITAWSNGVEVALAVVIGGSYTLFIHGQSCLVVSANLIPVPSLGAAPRDLQFHKLSTLANAGNLDDIRA